jgi:hypothetical protein
MSRSKHKFDAQGQGDLLKINFILHSVTLGVLYKPLLDCLSYDNNIRVPKTDTDSDVVLGLEESLRTIC